MLKVYGKNPKREALQKIKQSPQYQKGAFQNLSVTPMMAEDSNYWKVLRDFMRKSRMAKPAANIPHVDTILSSIASRNPFIVWFGHSSYFIRMGGKNFLIDPVFSGHASPFSFMIPAFKGSNTYTAADMPEIDFLLLTHDHYDHLDFKTLQQLKNKVKNIYCSLGIGTHLQYWGYNENIIHEMDWYDSVKIDDKLQLTTVPARHFSGRGLLRNQTLWSAFILNDQTHKLFLGGDSGYDTHFKTIGEKYGPFDIALLECGQYNTAWKYIHMMPEETVQAAIDLGAKILMPVHWAKFSLSLHAWNEPIQRAVRSAKQRGLRITTPRIGEPVILDENYPDTVWWEI